MDEPRHVFLSVGKTSTPEQEAFVAGIERHLIANGLVPRTVGRTAFSSEQPLKLVAELMRECRGAVIVAFERTLIERGRDRRGSAEESSLEDVKLPTVWNQIEAAMAYVHGHPLLVLAENGIKSEGLIEGRYDWFVQWCKVDPSSLASTEFSGVFGDWRRRVEARAAVRKAQADEVPAARSPPSRDGSSEELERRGIGSLLGSLNVRQLWAVVSTLVLVGTGIASAAFTMGQRWSSLSQRDAPPPANRAPTHVPSQPVAETPPRPVVERREPGPEGPPSRSTAAQPAVAALVDAAECRRRCDELCRRHRGAGPAEVGHFCSDDGDGRRACLKGDPGADRPRCNDPAFLGQ